MDDLLPGMLHLSRDGDATLTRQLTDQLRDLVTNGHLAPGQRLPSSRQLAQLIGELARQRCAAVARQMQHSRQQVVHNWPYQFVKTGSNERTS